MAMKTRFSIPDKPSGPVAAAAAFSSWWPTNKTGPDHCSPTTNVNSVQTTRSEHNIHSAPFDHRSSNTKHQQNNKCKSMSERNAKQNAKYALQQMAPNRTPSKTSGRRHLTTHSTKQEAADGIEQNTRTKQRRNEQNARRKQASSER